MVPFQRTSWVFDSAIDSDSYVATLGSIADYYLEFGLPTQAAITAGVTLLLAVLVLGLAPEYGRQTVDTASRSPIISTVIGIPGLFALTTLLYTGHLLASSSIGVIFAVPLVAVGTILLPAWTAIGFVTIGGAIARRFGSHSRPLWLVVGSVVAGLATLAFPYGLVLLSLAAVVGVGAGARAAFGGGGVGSEERVVPPANKV